MSVFPSALCCLGLGQFSNMVLCYLIAMWHWVEYLFSVTFLGAVSKLWHSLWFSRYLKHCSSSWQPAWLHHSPAGQRTNTVFSLRLHLEWKMLFLLWAITNKIYKHISPIGLNMHRWLEKVLSNLWIHVSPSGLNELNSSWRLTCVRLGHPEEWFQLLFI